MALMDDYIKQMQYQGLMSSLGNIGAGLTAAGAAQGVGAPPNRGQYLAQGFQGAQQAMQPDPQMLSMLMERQQQAEQDKMFQSYLMGGSEYADAGQGSSLMANLTPEQRAEAMMRYQMGDTSGALGSLFEEPSAPTMRDFKEGNEIVTKQFDPQTQQWVEVARAPRYKPGTTVNMPDDVSDTVQTVREIERLRSTGDPRDAAIADRLEMGMTFSTKPPEAYVKSNMALGQARESVGRVYEMLEEGTSAIMPEDRARMAQEFENLKLAYAELTNRGANFTDTEQQMIESVIAGNPNDVVQRALQGDQAYMERLQRVGQLINQRGRSLVDAYTKLPGEGEPFPWEKEEGSGAVDFNDLPE